MDTGSAAIFFVEVKIKCRGYHLLSGAMLEVPNLNISRKYISQHFKFCLFDLKFYGLVMSSQSVNLFTLFLGRLYPHQYFVFILWPVTDNCLSWISRRGEWPKKLFHSQSPQKLCGWAGIWTCNPWICNQIHYWLRYWVWSIFQKDRACISGDAPPLEMLHENSRPILWENKRKISQNLSAN